MDGEDLLHRTKRTNVDVACGSRSWRCVWGNLRILLLLEVQPVVRFGDAFQLSTDVKSGCLVKMLLCKCVPRLRGFIYMLRVFCFLLQILANLVMEKLLPELRDQIGPRLKGKMQERQKNWTLVINQ